MALVGYGDIEPYEVLLGLLVYDYTWQQIHFATSKIRFFSHISYTHFHRNTRMRLISLYLKVLSLPPINTSFMVVQNVEIWEIPRYSLQLYLQCIHMIQIHMGVSHRMDESSGSQIAHIRKHVRQQSVRGDVERDTESHIA